MQRTPAIWRTFAAVSLVAASFGTTSSAEAASGTIRPVHQFTYTGAGTTAGTIDPSGVVVESAGSVVLAGTDGLVRIDSAGNFVEQDGGVLAAVTYQHLAERSDGQIVFSTDPGDVFDRAGVGVMSADFDDHTAFAGDYDGLGSVDHADVAVDARNWAYVVDTDNARVLVFEDEFQLFEFAFDGSGTAGALVNPVGIAIHQNRVYVSDPGANNIFVYDRQGNYVESFDDASATGLIAGAQGMDVDENGTVWVANGSVVLALAPDGTFINAFGDFGPGPGELFNATDVSVRGGLIAVVEPGRGEIEVYAFECASQRVTIYGTDAGETIRGTSERDVIHGFGGADLIIAGGGDDLICPGTGDDTVRAGGGNDTSIGTSSDGDDTILGHGGSDVLYGGDGADDLNGGGQDDELFGGDGDDTVVGGPGNDLVEGNFGDDVVRGAVGDDDVRGGFGDDRAFGNGGVDDVRGGGDDDTVVSGGSGDDFVSGGPGSDTMQGNNGDDVLDGGSGDDTLNGGVGADALNGMGGFDRCSGGVDGQVDTASSCELEFLIP